MKRMKKLLSLVLAMMMVLAMGIPAMAAEVKEPEKGTITIDNAIPGQTYNVYRIFDLESYNSNSEAFSYKLAEKWAGFLDVEGVSVYVTRDEDNAEYIKWVGDNTAGSAQAFAKLAMAYAKASNIAPDATQTPAKDDDTAKVAIKFEDLPLGYYMVQSDTSEDALLSLDTMQPNVTMKEKNGEPTIDKEVQDGTDANGNPVWNNDNTASIGDTVNYQAVINVKGTAVKYVVNDTMSKGLTFDEDSVTVVRIPVGETAETTVDSANYKTTVEPVTDGTNFKVTFGEDFLKTLGAGDTLIVRYSATVNADAVIADVGNPNKVKLEYENDQETEESTTTTYVYEFDVDKFTIRENETDHTQLAGAKFTLSTKVDENNNAVDPIAFSKVEEEGLDKDVYKVNKGSKETVITTGESGRFTLSGLAAGTYYLTEIEAPAGYNKLAAPIKVEITEKKDEVTGERTGEFTINGGVKDNTVEVENKTGAELPSTGGIGTTIFYVLGGILVVGAGIMLVVKKRMSSEK